MSEQNILQSQDLAVVSPHAEKTCNVCRKIGVFQSWSICTGDHMCIICPDCIKNRVSKCLQKNCEFQLKLNKVILLAELKAAWCKSSTDVLGLGGKITNNMDIISELQPRTFVSFQSILRQFSTYSYQLSLQDYERYINLFIEYILQINAPIVKQQMSIRIQKEDYALEKTRECHLAVINRLSTLKKGNLKKQKKLEFTIKTFECGICAITKSVPYIWTYCREIHPDYEICFKCVVHLDTCPICRKPLRTESIIECEEALDKWTKNYQKILSCFHLAQSLTSNKLSYFTSKIIFNKVQKLFKGIPKNQQNLYSRCIKSWTSEWCKEKNRDRCILEIIRTMQNQYLQSCKIIDEYLEKIIESAKVEIAKKINNQNSIKNSQVQKNKNLNQKNDQQTKVTRRREKRRERSISVSSGGTSRSQSSLNSISQYRRSPSQRSRSRLQNRYSSRRQRLRDSPPSFHRS